MKTSLSSSAIEAAFHGLSEANQLFAARYPGALIVRQPVHTYYAPADQFRSNSIRMIRDQALQALDQYAPDEYILANALGIPIDLTIHFYGRLRGRLRSEPVEDYRLDFEDGYGNRPDREEDQHAVSAAIEVANAWKAKTLPRMFGIRIKPLTEELRTRSVRTLDLFLTTLLEHTGGVLPPEFVVTLPKVSIPEQTAAFARVLEQCEQASGLPNQSLRFEFMVEITQALLNARGECNLPLLYDACTGRCTGIALGIYDYTTSCGIAPAYQNLLHPSADFARSLMQVIFSGMGVPLSDGGTNILPIPKHPGPNLSDDELHANQLEVRNAWKIHFQHIQHALIQGFYQGWDVHPAQLVARYAAVFAFYVQNMDVAAARMKSYLKKASAATEGEGVAEDVATGQTLLNFFSRAISSGAVSAEDIQMMTGLRANELKEGSFAKILKARIA